mgnify:CR=1 FL=1
MGVASETAESVGSAGVGGEAGCAGRVVRADRGPSRSCATWQAAWALGMGMTTLDPGGAENREKLGG